MRRHVLSKAATRVVCTLSILLVSSNSFGQIRRLPTEAKPRPHLSEPRPSGSGLSGTTPILHESAKLTASDAEDQDLFGLSVSVSGDTALIGTPEDDCPGSGSHSPCGSAYVFRFNGTGWVEEQKLTASDGAGIDRFGSAVSLGGDTAIVAAPGDDCTLGEMCGSAYVFRFTGSSWVEEQKLTASDADFRDAFGSSVSLSGRTAMVGAYSVDCAAPGLNCGAVYVFRFNGTRWVEEQKLTASDAVAGDDFGWSVSVSGDVAVVGASYDDFTSCEDCGSAYVFRFDGTEWVEEQKLTASDADFRDKFGGSVSVSGDSILVGTLQDKCMADFECGSAYVFRFNGTTWVEERKLIFYNPGSTIPLSTSVSMRGETAAVGAWTRYCFGCGSAHIFRFNGYQWIDVKTMTAYVSSVRDQFGRAVSASGNVAMVSAPAESCAAGGGCGAVYVFRVTRPADFDRDGDVDLFDFAAFQGQFAGVLPNFVSFQSEITGPR